jgi:hypothetical protein
MRYVPPWWQQPPLPSAREAAEQLAATEEFLEELDRDPEVQSWAQVAGVVEELRGDFG